MLREAIAERLKEGMKARDRDTVSAVRLILAALKEHDVALRGKGRAEGLSDGEIAAMLQGMVKQRREAIALFEKGHRPDLVAKERREIAVIESFLPRPLGSDEIEEAAKAAIAELGASQLKDMGRVMAALRERHAGAIDLSLASPLVRRLLEGPRASITCAGTR
jgi:uncharacterized protein